MRYDNLMATDSPSICETNRLTQGPKGNQTLPSAFGRTTDRWNSGVRRAAQYQEMADTTLPEFKGQTKHFHSDDMRQQLFLGWFT
jgi:hypothetical protein